MAAKASKRGRGRGKGTEPETEPADSPEAPPLASDEAADPGETPVSAEATPPLDERHETEAAPEATEPADPEVPGRPGAAGWSVSHLVVIGLTALLVAAVVAGALLYATTGETGRLELQAQRLDAAEQAISGLQAELGQVTAGVGNLQSTVEANRQALDQMGQGIEELRNAVQALPAGGSAAGEAVTELQESIATQGSSLEDLAGRITRLEEEISNIREERTEIIQEAESATALGRAHAALAGRIAAGEPFADELEAVAAELPDAPGLDTLRPLAEEGVPTTQDLRARLAEIAAGLPSQETEETAAADGFWQTMRERVEGMVTVRRADEADWSAVLARADEDLQTGDIEAAIAEVEQVSAAPPDEIEAWLVDVRARAQAEAALEQLSDTVLRQFAGRR